ncbi:MAG: hypothetical protein CMM52_06210 [Rhodospirillaceae bacterium]|nr:hypothetical protein [Rhodospirillaceae bacterium]|tara:strand:+ start:1965 stop:2270 length:306 start_codon:yes stop_codon:yes gene_type:complete
MLRTALVTVAIASLGVFSPASAQQPMCTDRTQVIAQLSQQYSEAPVAMGVANNGGVLEILSSSAGKSWTIILTMPNGVSCMLAAGENWEALPTMTKLDPPA